MDFAHTSSAVATSEGALASAEPDPKCEHGLRAGTFCCPKASCNVCGGKTCSTPPNVGADCCVTVIANNGRSCMNVSAPCNIGAKPVRPYKPAETLTAKRSWFLVDEGFLSLTAGVELQSADASISVAMEQSLLNGTGVTVAAIDGTGSKPIQMGNSSFPGAAKLLVHRGIVYAALGESGAGAPPMLRASAGPQIGSWHEISGESSNATVTADGE